MKEIEKLITDKEPDVATGDTDLRATLSDKTAEDVLQGVSTGTDKQVYATSSDGKFIR